jgi:Tfp pilus assembly protein PilN
MPYLLRSLRLCLSLFLLVTLISKSDLFAQSKFTQADAYQRKIPSLSSDQIKAQKAYHQLIEALDQKDQVKAKALQQLIQQLYPQSIYAQRLNRKGASTQLSIALISTLSIFLIDFQNLIKKTNSPKNQNQ